MTRERSLTIRSHLLLLASGAVLPVLVFAVVVSVILVEQERRTFERGAIERARAMMSAVDASLRGSLSTLQALAASRALAAGDLGGFRESALRLLPTQPAWHNITLGHPSGERIVDVLTAPGAPLPPILDLASAERVVKTEQPIIGDVSRQRPDSPPVVPVRVPVLRDGVVAYVLTAQVRPESFATLIREQQLSEGWVAGLIDGKGNFVARVPPRPAGEPASAAFRAESQRAKEGWFRGLTVEGRDTFTAFQRSALGSNWAIGLAVPSEIVLGSATRTAWLMGLGALTALALGFVLAVATGNRIVRPMKTLASLARSVGDGSATIALPHGGLQEIDAIGLALKQAHGVVRERQSLIQREKDAVEAADRAKDEFIATLSHELRNPLAALTSAAAILRRNDLNSDVGREAREVIERQIANMSRMIEDLLDLSRVIAGKISLKLERFDLALLVSSVVTAWQKAGRLGRHAVAVETRAAWVVADRTRLEQIVANLLDNAVKFTPTGKHVRVVVAPNDEWAELIVDDDGRGIAPELLDRVFDPFVQGDQWMSPNAGGLGLGLALVKRLVELQGGSVSVASAGVGRGASFSVRLPRAEARSEESAAFPSTTSKSPGKKRVLVIDDNEDARKSLATLLAFEGHDTYEAASGARGTELASHVRPEIALIDIGLPDLNGYEVARRIRADLNSGVALIAVTGYGQPEDQRRAFDAGFDAHLVKPITIAQLNEVLTAARPQTPIASTEHDD
ncbi:MAG: response regulator [Betaproteobacteria bacterium]|nr:MAG: response regulator [Betaproteobacteria bacterium]